MALGPAKGQRVGDRVAALIGMMDFEIEQGALVRVSLHIVAGQVPAVVSVRARHDRLVADTRQTAPTPGLAGAARDKTVSSVSQAVCNRTYVEAAITGGGMGQGEGAATSTQCTAAPACNGGGRNVLRRSTPRPRKGRDANLVVATGVPQKTTAHVQIIAAIQG
eukprot:SAG11_NODE_6245_length_1353_cov_3.007177_1_plen_164_part_00